MGNLALAKNLHLEKAAAKYNQLLSKRCLRRAAPTHNQSSSGFTFIELLIVILMIGILVAIAGPSWIGFVNNQRVNVANDALLRALQEAQREAKRTKRSYSVSFKTENNVPKVAIYRAKTPPTLWKWESLGKDLELKPGQVMLGTNLSGENTAGSSLSYASSTAQTITFNYMGNLPRNANLGNNDKGLIVTVAVPQSGNSTQVLDATRRCVKVTSLLGAMEIGKTIDCNVQ